MPFDTFVTTLYDSYNRCHAAWLVIDVWWLKRLLQVLSRILSLTRRWRFFGDTNWRFPEVADWTEASSGRGYDWDEGPAEALWPGLSVPVSQMRSLGGVVRDGVQFGPRRTDGIQGPAADRELYMWLHAIWVESQLMDSPFAWPASIHVDWITIPWTFFDTSISLVY